LYCNYNAGKDTYSNGNVSGGNDSHSDRDSMNYGHSGDDNDDGNGVDCSILASNNRAGNNGIKRSMGVPLALTVITITAMMLLV
jgi:hypothetical protein